MGISPSSFAPCESLDPAALEWLLDHGANPNCRDDRYEIRGHANPGTALDYLIAGYARSLERLSTCIDLLLQAAGETKYNIPAVLAVLRGRQEDLSRLMDTDPGVVDQSFPQLDCGQTGGRSLLLQGGTLLHVAAEYGNVAAATLLLDRGAAVNAPATVDEAGGGGQTPIFHAVTQSGDDGLPVTQLLLERGADLDLRVKLPGGYERPGEIVECTPLGNALLFGGDSQRRTVTLLRDWGAVE